jgi:CRP-like cAMP-binding protein
MAILYNDKRNATIKAVKPGRVWVLDRTVLPEAHDPLQHQRARRDVGIPRESTQTEQSQS